MSPKRRTRATFVMEPDESLSRPGMCQVRVRHAACPQRAQVELAIAMTQRDDRFPSLNQTRTVRACLDHMQIIARRADHRIITSRPYSPETP